MVKATRYPGADTTTRWKGNGNATLATINKIVLHTTESSSLPSYASSWPNLTYDPKTRKWWQHAPINGSATALRNDGSHQTNRANVVQIEIIGFANGSPSLPASAIDDLGKFVAWMNGEWGVPIVATPRWTGPNTTARMTWTQYTAFKGILGHQHVPGNIHWDPGQINADAIVTAAKSHLGPDVTPARTLLNLNAQWPGFASTHTALPWPTRCRMLGEAIVKSNATIATVQELGIAEASQLAAHLPGWKYQRANGGGKGLNCVFWKTSEWTFGKLYDWNLESFGQMQRTLIAVRLDHRDGSYVWAGSTHLAAAASDLSAANAIKARTAQANQIGELLADFRQVLVGADWNSRYPASSPTSVRGLLAAAGFTFKAPIDDGKHNGIDGVGAKQRVTLLTEKVYPLGKASDHDGRIVTFTTPKG